MIYIELKGLLWINVFYVIMYVLYVLYITYIRSTAKKMGHMLVAARLQVGGVENGHATDFLFYFFSLINNGK